MRAAPDYVVLGGGTAGLVAAVAGAEVGAKVVLVEHARTGGDCLWTGCVPSKTLLAAAARGASFDAAMASVRAAIAHIEPEDSPEVLRDLGVDVVTGSATFAGTDSVRVEGRELSFARALVATGAAPRVPTIPGLPEVTALTSETVWDLTTLPPSLLVVGAGPVGCEMAQAFARLGSQVTVVEQQSTVLPGWDPQASQIVADALRSDGVRLLTHSTVAAVTQRSLPEAGRDAGVPGVMVEVSGPDPQTSTHAALLLAVGREPRSAHLGLERARVAVDAAGAVITDPQGRTSNRRVYAAGDVTGGPHLTHLAAEQAGAATAHALLGVSTGKRRHRAPQVVYTDPEVARVGVGTSPGSEAARVIRYDHRHVDRAVAEDRTAGFSALAVDRRDRIVGATVVSPRAGETIGELSLAVQTGVTVTRLARTTHPYPTYSDGAWRAAVEDVRDRLRGPVAGRAARTLLAVQRRRG